MTLWLSIHWGGEKNSSSLPPRRIQLNCSLPLPFVDCIIAGGLSWRLRQWKAGLGWSIGECSEENEGHIENRGWQSTLESPGQTTWDSTVIIKHQTLTSVCLVVGLKWVCFRFLCCWGIISFDFLGGRASSSRAGSSVGLRFVSSIYWLLSPSLLLGCLFLSSSFKGLSLARLRCVIYLQVPSQRLTPQNCEKKGPFCSFLAPDWGWGGVVIDVCE